MSDRSRCGARLASRSSGRCRGRLDTLATDSSACTSCIARSTELPVCVTAAMFWRGPSLSDWWGSAARIGCLNRICGSLVANAPHAGRTVGPRVATEPTAVRRGKSSPLPLQQRSRARRLDMPKQAVINLAGPGIQMDLVVSRHPPVGPWAEVARGAANRRI